MENVSKKSLGKRNNTGEDNIKMYHKPRTDDNVYGTLMV